MCYHYRRHGKIRNSSIHGRFSCDIFGVLDRSGRLLEKITRKYHCYGHSNAICLLVYIFCNIFSRSHFSNIFAKFTQLANIIFYITYIYNIFMYIYNICIISMKYHFKSLVGLLSAGAMGLWHGVEYYEKEKIVGEEYYQQWNNVSTVLNFLTFLL